MNDNANMFLEMEKHTNAIYIRYLQQYSKIMIRKEMGINTNDNLSKLILQTFAVAFPFSFNVEHFRGFSIPAGDNCLSCIRSFIRTIAYSKHEIKTLIIHKTRNISNAFKPFDIGAPLFDPMNMLIRTRSIVASNPILPGTTSGGMRKEIHETMTNNVQVR